MLVSFKLNRTTRLLIIAGMVGISGNVAAVTVIDRDTEIDNTSTPNEAYQISNGATLTVNGATTGTLQVLNGETGSVIINNGSAVKGLIIRNGSAAISGATLADAAAGAGTGVAIYDGTLDIRNSKAGILGLYGATQGVAYNLNAGLIIVESDVGKAASFRLMNSDISRTVGFSVYLNTNGHAEFINSKIAGQENAVVLATSRSVNPSDRSSFTAINTEVTSVDSAVFSVGRTGTSTKGYGDIYLEAGSTAFSGSGELFQAINQSIGTLNLDDSHAQGNVRADASSSTSVVLRNGSTLVGGMFNVNSLELDSSSAWSLTDNSAVTALNLGGGTVRFSPSSGSDFRTLTLGTLEGGGHVFMNTNAASMQGDFIDVAGAASGAYTLHVANTGAEPDRTEDALQLVRTGGGDASFSLSGGRVDIGAWQYSLARNGNQWGLVQAGTTPDPGPEPDPEPEPGPSTSASTDAVLSMASAPKFMFYGELDNLRTHTQARQAGHDAGVWGSFITNNDRVQGAWSSAYRLEQNGMMLGADSSKETAAGTLVTGTFISASSGRIRHSRGGTSRIGSWGGGLYATLQADSGWYLDGVMKLNRFDSDLSATMTDGTGVKGSWDTWGYGASLEAGRQLGLPGSLSLTPYAGISAYQNQAKRIALSNDMVADTGNGRAVRAEAGMRAAAALMAGDVPVTPYVTAALTQELVKGGRVRINDDYDFRNDFTGTGGRVSGGLSVAVTPSATLWAEAGYGRSEKTESPVSGNAGVRISF